MHMVVGALAACNYLSNMREKIFNVLYKELNSTNTELQKAAHECMQKVSCCAMAPSGCF